MCENEACEVLVGESQSSKWVVKENMKLELAHENEVWYNKNEVKKMKEVWEQQH